MSKHVKIPDYSKPYYIVEVNGVRYSYPAGGTRYVPDEVAAVIEAQESLKPVEGSTISNAWKNIKGMGDIVITETVGKIYCLEVQARGSICGFQIQINGEQIMPYNSDTVSYHYVKMNFTPPSFEALGIVDDCYMYYGEGGLCMWSQVPNSTDDVLYAPTKTVRIIDESGGEAGNDFYYKITEYEVVE